MLKLLHKSKRVLLAGLGTVAVISLATFGCIVNQSGYYSAKYAATEFLHEPQRAPLPLQPLLQVDGHTCGFLATSAVYRAYGLDPEQRNLRFRIGVDAKALPHDSSSKGTLHPDLFRVLGQDGFHLTVLDLEHPDAAGKLRRHTQHDAALVLLESGNGGLHWVAVDGADNGQLRVCDSIGAEVRLLPAADLLEDAILSIVLLDPLSETGPSPRSNSDYHADGLREMASAFRRMGKE